MGRGVLLSAGILSALFAETAGWAQQRPNGAFLTSPLSLSAGYDDNFVADSRVLDDSVVLLTAPTFSWIKSTHRARWSVDYKPEFEIFSRNPDLNSWNHVALLKYSYRLTSRLSLDAGDSFLSTSDASRSLGESQFLLPRGRYRQNSFFTGLKYRLGQRTVLFFRFDNAITALTVPGSRSNLSDQLTNAGTLTLDHTITRHHSVTASYALLHVRPLDGSASGGFSYQAVHSLNTGYMYSVNPGFNIRLTGGVVRGREFAYTAGGAVEKQLRGVWVMAGYQRYLSFFGGFAPTGGTAGDGPAFASGLMPDSVFQALSLRVRGKLTRRMGLEFSGQHGRTNLGERGVRSLIAQSRLDYRLNDRLILFARADYYGQNVSPFTGVPLSRRRYFGGLEIVLSRPPEAEGTLRRRGGAPKESARPQATDLPPLEGK